MIVGRGIIARSMSDITHENLTVFASGVSDSSCTDASSFAREADLLLSQSRERKMIYFSTCSLSDGTKTNQYLSHKENMERLVATNFEDWLVLRIPTIVGWGGNSNNFFNHISSKLISGDTVFAQERVFRSLLDSEDLIGLTERLIKELSSTTIDVCLDNSDTALNIVSLMKNISGSKSEVVAKSDAFNHRIDNSTFKETSGSVFTKFNIGNYNERLIKKYLRL